MNFKPSKKLNLLLQDANRIQGFLRSKRIAFDKKQFQFLKSSILNEKERKEIKDTINMGSYEIYSL